MQTAFILKSPRHPRHHPHHHPGVTIIVVTIILVTILILQIIIFQFNFANFFCRTSSLAGALSVPFRLKTFLKSVLLKNSKRNI